MFSAVRIEVENLDLHTYTQRGTQFYACAQRWFLLARRLTSWFCLPVWHSRRFLNKKRTREAPYWRVELRSSAPGGADLMETVLLWFFPSLFIDFMKDGLGPESLQIHFFLLIIALLDLGGIRFLLSCCVLHILCFFESSVPW